MPHFNYCMLHMKPMKREWNTMEEERAGAKKKALALLMDMDRTESGLREKLQKGGFSEDAVDEALDYVRGYGYIDDERYANHFVEVSKSRKSRRRMEYDLAKRGVSRDLIDAAMEKNAPEDERPLIRELAVKKLNRMDAEDPKTRGKLAAYLARQGFKTEDVISVTDELLRQD